MTGSVSPGEVIALRIAGHGGVRDLHAVVPIRAENSIRQAGESELSNVIPFARPRASDGRGAPEVVLPTDLARLPAEMLPRDRVRLSALAVLSLLLHGGLFALLMREPPPLASIGIEVISVELVLGATAPAGVATAPGENEMQSASAPDEQATEPEQAEQKATEQPQEIEVARQETAPEQKPELAAKEIPKEEPRQEVPRPYETAAAPQEAAPEPAKVPDQASPETAPPVAMVETPEPDMATAAPRETPPDRQEFSLLPPPVEKPVEQKAEPKPKQAAPKKPVKNAATARERRRIAARTRDQPARQAKASAPSSQANNVGVGRSSNETNYRGLVAAHLARHKQFPADARSRGIGGTAAVTFTIGGSGSVASVRLARGSGVASIDQEVVAMVRRASPFPAPPSGRSVSFTVPVNFRLN